MTLIHESDEITSFKTSTRFDKTTILHWHEQEQFIFRMSNKGPSYEQLTLYIPDFIVNLFKFCAY